MSDIYERRRGVKYNGVFTFLRLAIELIAIVWAVAGLNNATNTLKEIVLENKKDIVELRRDVNSINNRVGIIEVKIQ